MSVIEINKLKFIEKAKVKYNNKYDYSKSEYVDLRTKVLVICPEHGEFYVTPRSHLKCNMCPDCFNPYKAANNERRIARLRELALEGKGSASKEAIAKRKATCLERYGAKTWSESKEGREFAIEKSADPEVRAKMSERMKDPKTRAKYKATSKKNFGSEHWTKSEFGKEYLHELFNTEEERKARSERASSEQVRAKTQKTSLERYGTLYYWQNEDAKVRLKGLLNDPEVIEKTKKTNLERYGHESWSSSDIGKSVLASDEIRIKMAETKRRNGTINGSKPEKLANAELIKVFGEDNVIAQYRDINRYPFDCDFYIKSLDLFIELNIHWIHGYEWYDSNNVLHQERVQFLRSKILGKKSIYERAIYIWTKNDPEKKKIAEKNGLNYLVFWNQNLSDFYEWLKEYYKN